MLVTWIFQLITICRDECTTQLHSSLHASTVRIQIINASTFPHARRTPVRVAAVAACKNGEGDFKVWVGIKWNKLIKSYYFPNLSPTCIVFGCIRGCFKCVSFLFSRTVQSIQVRALATCNAFKFASWVSVGNVLMILGMNNSIVPSPSSQYNFRFESFGRNILK
jgi:hypothetical protein